MNNSLSPSVFPSLNLFIIPASLSLPSVSLLLLFSLLAASEALCENHQPGREQEEQEGDGEEGRAGERETRSGEHEEEQTTGHQVS